MRRYPHGTTQRRGHVYDDDMVSDVAYSPDGKWLAVEHDLVIDLRHTGSGEIQTTIPAITFFSHMRFSRDMRYAFVYINGTQPYLYPWSDIVNSTTFTPREGSLFRLSSELDWQDLSASVFSSDVQRLAVSVFRQSIQIFDVNSGQLLHSLPIDGAATELAFSPDNELLAATICHIKNIEQTLSCLFQLIGVETGTVLYTSPMFEEAIYNLTFDPDGKFLATAHGRIEAHYDDGRSKENAVRLWGVPFTE